jgi:cytochrome c2
MMLLSGCEEEPPQHLRVAGGNPELGRLLVGSFGCNACHEIPGIGQPQGSVGPTLVGFGRRAYIAGRLPNRPATLTAWLQDPPAFEPETAMPAVGLDEAEARHIAAFLYELR